VSARDAIAIAADIAAGRTTAEAVIAETLADIARLDPALNAFTLVMGEQALADARRLDAAIAAGAPAGPLAGAPFAVKNLYDIKGVVTLAGSIIRRDAGQAAADAPLIARLKAAGAILVGALNMDEFAYGFVTENAHYGATHNPHDLARVAGGSSGGSAAAVAAGLVPFSLGSDTNGSIRVPAGLCGVFGLKPTFGRLNREGVFPFVDSLDHAGPFARSVGDLAAAYDAMADAGAAVGAALEAAADRPMRVGVLGGWFTDGAFPEVLESLARAGEALEARFGVIAPGAEAARSAAFCLTTQEGARLHERDILARPGDFDPAVRDRLRAGLAVPDEVAAAARAWRPVFRDQMRGLFEAYDVLLAPSTPCPAPLIGQATMPLNGRDVSVRRNLGAYTQPISFIGLPVVAAPVNRPGLPPVGVQIIAPAWREDLAFAAARRLERLGIVAAHRPEVFA
jgi:aspartyl-tRNA(Asn)/glutamyl-tRNA(Gln) amidotransferase subunit A